MTLVLDESVVARNHFPMKVFVDEIVFCFGMKRFWTKVFLHENVFGRTMFLDEFFCSLDESVPNRVGDTCLQEAVCQVRAKRTFFHNSVFLLSLPLCVYVLSLCPSLSLALLALFLLLVLLHMQKKGRTNHRGGGGKEEPATGRGKREGRTDQGRREGRTTHKGGTEERTNQWIHNRWREEGKKNQPQRRRARTNHWRMGKGEPTTGTNHREVKTRGSTNHREVKRSGRTNHGE